MVFSLLAALCAGELVLLITGLMGMSGLCSFSRALSAGGVGFLDEVLNLFLVNDFIALL